jgi:hypothetical protein
VIASLAAAPSPAPTEQLDATTVTPGLVGFLVTFAVVLAAIALFQLMTRSLRRTARNATAQGMELSEPARVGHGFPLPVRAPEPTVPGVLDGGTPYGPTTSPSPDGRDQGGDVRGADEAEENGDGGGDRG